MGRNEGRLQKEKRTHANTGMCGCAAPRILTNHYGRAMTNLRALFLFGWTFIKSSLYSVIQLIFDNCQLSNFSRSVFRL